MINGIVNNKYSCEEASELLNNSDLHNELDYFPGLRWAEATAPEANAHSISE
jgi:hypothetical protein